MYRGYRYCRWCGKEYQPHGYTFKDGFCLDSCKQAHYRAYNKYVTDRASRISTVRNANKKRSKKKI